MYSATGPVVPRSQPPRDSVSGPTPQSQYATSSIYAQQPSISHQLPTPSEPNFPQQGLPQQATAPGAFASNETIPIAHPPSHLFPSGSRARSSSPGQSGPSPSETQDLRRSHSLNETMSNPQTGYYPMAAAAPMGGYQQHQLYNQGAMSQSGYYAAVPQSPVGLAPGYMGETRQEMPGMNYGYASMPYSQSSYQPNYATSYAGNSSVIAPSYGSPVASQQYPRAGQPAPLGGAQAQMVDRAKKPQCWEHGCNGREFSTFSNLLRHQREKSGTAQKSYCPHCGAEFTRTTARNGHMEHGKCKTRRTATGSSS